MAGSHTVPSAREAGPLDGQPCSPSEVCRTGKIRDRAPRGGPTDDCRRGGENDRAMSRYPAVPDPRGENCRECPLRARQINTNRSVLFPLALTRSLCAARTRAVSGLIEARREGKRWFVNAASLRTRVQLLLQKPPAST